MAEYNKESLYFVKLPKDFFQSHYMRILESMPNGKDYELLYLKLMLESVSHGGWLRFSEEIPYTIDLISGLTNTPIDTARVGLEVLVNLGLIEKRENQSLFIPEIPKLTTITTIGAQKKQNQIESRKSKGGTKVEKIPPDIRY